MMIRFLDLFLEIVGNPKPCMALFAQQLWHSIVLLNLRKTNGKLIQAREQSSWMTVWFSNSAPCIYLFWLIDNTNEINVLAMNGHERKSSSSQTIRKRITKSVIIVIAVPTSRNSIDTKPIAGMYVNFYTKKMAVHWFFCSRCVNLRVLELWTETFPKYRRQKCCCPLSIANTPDRYLCRFLCNSSRTVHFEKNEMKIDSMDVFGVVRK